MTNRPRLTPAMADVRRAVRENWDAAGVAEGDLVLVAVSGGADSMALAAAAAFEGARAGIRVGAVVVEHGLQEATKVVAAQTAETLGGWGLSPVDLRTVVVGNDGGPEAAARTARYDALDAARVQTGARFVMLGHTLDDQAETVLLGWLGVRVPSRFRECTRWARFTCDRCLACAEKPPRPFVPTVASRCGTIRKTLTLRICEFGCATRCCRCSKKPSGQA